MTQRPSLPSRWNSVDHVGALTWIEPRQRLVQHDQPWVVDDRLGELDPLPHALRVGRQPTLVVRVELDGRERRPGGAVGVGKAVQAGRQAHERERGERLEHPFLLRHEPELPRDGDVGARVAAEQPHRALRGSREPAEHPEHRRLTGAVRAEQRRNPGADVEADVGDGDDVPEPLRDAADLDQRIACGALAHRRLDWRR